MNRRLHWSTLLRGAAMVALTLATGLTQADNGRRQRQVLARPAASGSAGGVDHRQGRVQGQDGWSDRRGRLRVQLLRHAGHRGTGPHPPRSARRQRRDHGLAVPVGDQIRRRPRWRPRRRCAAARRSPPRGGSLPSAWWVRAGHSSWALANWLSWRQRCAQASPTSTCIPTCHPAVRSAGRFRGTITEPDPDRKAFRRHRHQPLLGSDWTREAAAAATASAWLSSRSSTRSTTWVMTNKSMWRLPSVGSFATRAFNPG